VSIRLSLCLLLLLKLVSARQTQRTQAAMATASHKR